MRSFMATIGLLAGTVRAAPTFEWKQIGASNRSQPGVTAIAPQGEGYQNYPNPLDAASGFKTTIPFTTLDKGIASIRLVNDKGIEVLKDNEEVTYSGTHFFYFTAQALPAGVYYYQIEFPQGVVIQNKTLLIVR